MANGNEEFVDVTGTDEFTDIPQEEERVDTPIQVGGFGGIGPKIVKDPNVDGWRGYGIEVPDINFDFLKIERPEDITPEKLTAKESLTNTWNNVLDQLSLTDDRFYQLSEQLFGDLDSITAKEAQANIDEVEADQQEAGGTLALTDIPDAFEDEGLVGGLAHTGAAVANAISAFGASAIQAGLTGGAALATDMVQGSVQDYTRQRAEELGVSYEEAAKGLGSDVIIPIGLGALSYKFEKAGLKGVGKAIKGLAPGAKKAIISTLNASGKEGATEFAQGVVEAFNQGLGAKNSLDSAAENVGKFLEEDALETFLQGAVGGGVSAGGGRAVRRVASTIRSKAAEDAIADSQDKIMEIDAILNSPDIDDDQYKILQRTRTSLKNKIKSAIKEPNSLVRKLSDENINKIVKKSNDNRKLRRELDIAKENLDEDAFNIVKEDINDRLQKNADSINKTIELKESRNIRDEEGALYYGEIDRRFKEGEDAEVIAWDAMEQYAPKIRKVAASLWGGEAHGHKFEEFVQELTFPSTKDQSHSFYGLAKAYKPEVGSFGGWIESQLKNRATRVLDRVIKTQGPSGTAIGEDGISEDQLGTSTTGTTGGEIEGPGIIAKSLAHKLGFSRDTANTINDKVSEALTSDQILGKLTPAKIDGAFRTAARKALTKDVLRELEKDYDNKLNRNYKKYLSLIPAKSLNNSPAQTKAWATTPPTQKEFIDYMNAVGEEKNVAQKKYNRKEKLAEWISDGLFLEASKDFFDDKSVQKQFNVVNKIKDNPKAIQAVKNTIIQQANIVSESRINGVAGAVLKRKDVTPSEQMSAVLQQAWRANDFNANATTNRNMAKHALLRNGVFKTDKEAEKYIDGVNGFAFKNPNGLFFIYTDKEGLPQTAIHEFGHIWSDFVLSTNPQLWGQIIESIILERDTYFAKETMRLFNTGYYDKFGKDARTVIEGLYNASTDAERQDILKKVLNDVDSFPGTILALDEIMAGAIEQHGRKQVEDSLGTKLSKLLDKFWDHIAKLLGNVKGKEIKDLSIKELMDLVVNDVITGKPGSSFAEMNVPVGDNIFRESAGLAMQEYAESRLLPPQLKGYSGAARGNRLIATKLEVDPSLINMTFTEAWDTMGKDYSEASKLINGKGLAKPKSGFAIEWGKWRKHKGVVSAKEIAAQQKKLLAVMDKQDAANYESWKKQVKSINSLMTNQPDNPNFSKWEGVLDQNFKNLEKLNSKYPGFEDVIGFIPGNAPLMEQRKLNALNEIKTGSSLEIDKAYEHVADVMTKDEFLDYLDSLQEGLKADEYVDQSTEKLWAEAADGKVTLLKGRPAKAWQNDQARIDQKFNDNLAFFQKNEELYTQHLPAEFFLMLATPQGDGTRKDSFLRVEDAQMLADKAKPSGLKWDNPDAFGRLKTNSVAKLNKIANSSAYEAEVAENQAVLFAFGDAIQALAKAGVPTSELATLVKSFTNTGDGKRNIFRRAPRYGGYAEGIGNVKTTDIVPEHNPPAGYIALDMFKRAISGQWNQEAKNAIKDKFKYFVVDKTLDPGIKGLGDVTLKSGITKGFDITQHDPIVRYIVSGGDATRLRDTKGTPIVQKLGVPKSIDLKDSRKADTINTTLGILNGGVFENRKPQKGQLSAFDFDDTLFTTENVVTVIHDDGSKSLLNSSQFATFKAKEGDTLDFSDFATVKGAKALPALKDMEAAIKRGDDVVIVTARKMIAEAPVRKLLEKHLGKEATAKVKFKGVGSPDPNSKVKYIENVVAKHGHKGVFFIDDSKKNVDAVKKAFKDKAISVHSDFLENVDKIIAQAGRKPSKFTLPANAEDFKGLLYTLIPSGAEGQKVLEFFNKYLIKPYWKGVTEATKRQRSQVNAWNTMNKRFNIKENQDGIRAALAELNGQDHNYEGEISKDAKRVAEILDRGFGISLDPKDIGVPLNASILKAIDKNTRQKAMEDFATNIDAIFNDNTYRQLEQSQGREYVNALKNIIKRMKAGRNRLSAEPQNPFLNWAQRAVSTTLAWNLRSGLLQLLSTVNYVGLPGNTFGKALGAVTNVSQFHKDVAFLKSSPYIQERQQKSKFDVLAEEVSERGASKWLDKVFSGKWGGFSVTKWGDRNAISLGGATFYRNRINQLKKEGLNDKQAEKQAYQEFVEYSEASQQSADPANISQIQSTDTGKLFFAFANTPFQYARITKRKVQDLVSGRSKARGTERQDFGTAIYYTGLQTAIFTALQSGLAFALFDDDEDVKEDKFWVALERGLTSLLKSMGYGGAAAATGISIAAELGRQKTGYSRKDPARVAKAFLAASPPVSIKFGDIEGAAKATLKSKGLDEDGIKAAAEWTAFTTGFPADRVFKKINNLIDITNNDMETLERIARALGWSEWDFVSFKNKPAGYDPDFGSEGFDEDEFEDVEFDEDGFSDVPFNRGEVGQAHRDGTIEVDPNLTPLEREKTIKHEMHHVKQMEEDDLDYDDNYVYYKGKRHMRRNGKIRYNGRWHEEGGKKLPWEAEAYKAESPLNRTTESNTEGGGGSFNTETGEIEDRVEGGVDENRFDKEGNLITDPKLIDKRLRAADAEADTFTANWYNDPETRKRLKAQTYLTDEQIDERIKQATEVETRSKDIGYADAESHDRGTFMGEVIPEGEPGHFKGRIDVDSSVDPAAYGNKGLLEHEHAHQAGWDNQLGYKAQKILGKGKQGYMNNPAEVYGNMQEFRAILGLKPNQRNLTPTKIKAIIKAKGLDDQPDVQQMFYNFDIEKVSEALNTIASTSPKKKSLRDQYA